MKRKLWVAIILLAALWSLVSCGGGGGGATPTPELELTVNTTEDTGQGLCNNPGGSCSLREAINRANVTEGTVLIRFNISGSEVLKMIRPNSALPAVTGQVIIDGTTQPGYSGHPLVEIEGSWTSNTSGLTIRGAGSVVKGLMIVNFKQNGIDVRAPDVTVAQNYIGTDGGADVDMGNNGWGVDVTCSADGTEMPLRVLIGESHHGNVISGNDLGGVNINFDPCNGADAEARVWGNIIGLDAAGDGLIGNGGPGIRIKHASQNDIGFPVSGRRNYISGNHGNGIEILGTGSEKNDIQNNLIGTDMGGSAGRGNWLDGVYSEGNIVLVGGLQPEAGNVISANHEAGVRIAMGPALIQGNRIGTSQAGIAALGNLDGVVVKSCNTNTMIGGDESAARNIISGNTNAGILVRDSGACADGDVTVFGNYIGTNPDGTQAIGNSIGIHVWANHVTVGGEGARFNLISGNLTHGILIESNNNVIAHNSIGDGLWQGGALPNGEAGILLKGGAAGNTIESNAFHDNGTAAVQVMGGGLGNSIRKNSMRDDGGLGIALDGEVPLTNDILDVDSGSNGRQNHPVLDSAQLDGQTFTVSGSLGSMSGTTYTIDFYMNAACDPSGYGEGGHWLGSVNLTTNAQGIGVFQANLPSGLINTSEFITATATNPSSGTSDFSQCVAVTIAIEIPPEPQGIRFIPAVSPAVFFFGRCEPAQVEFSLEIADPPEAVDYVLLFVRLMDPKSGEKTAWSEGLSMIPAGKGKYRYSLLAEDVPDFNKFQDAVLQYQFVAYNKAQAVIGRSEVFGDVALRACGRIGPAITPTPAGVVP